MEQHLRSLCAVVVFPSAPTRRDREEAEKNKDGKNAQITGRIRNDSESLDSPVLLGNQTTEGMGEYDVVL